MRTPKIAIIAASLFSCAASTAPPSKLSDSLAAARTRLDLVGGRLAGPGASVLRDAISSARFVAVGEDHFTNEVPAFVSALCHQLADEHLTALALEIGPTAAETLAPILAGPDRITRMKRFTSRYPNAVAFLDSEADNNAAAECVRSGRKRPLTLLGLDQDYIGSAGLIIDRILLQHLSPGTRATLNALRIEERRDAANAKRSGDPRDLLLLSISQARVDALSKVFSKEASAKARQLFEEFAESAAIYRLNAAGDPTANTRRATLLKRHLAQRLPVSGKVLLKFGDWHLYRGSNPLGNYDLGNFVTELADGRGERSLHILVLGTRGIHATFAGYARSPGRKAFVMTEDPDYAWLKAAVDEQLSDGWTLFDLRRLRHRRFSDLDRDWDRVIEGYDFLLLVPELTPSASLAG